LISFKLSIGKTAVTTCDLFTNEAIAALKIRDDNRVLQDYLRYALAAKNWNTESDGHDKLMGRTLNKASLGAVRIPLPSLDEQRRIVKMQDDIQQLSKDGIALATTIDSACAELTRSALRAQLASLPATTRIESLASLIDSGVIYLNRGKIISKRDLNASPGDYPVYSSASANNGEFGRYGEFMFDEEAITWSIDGGGTFFHRPRHRFSVTNVGGILRIADLETMNYRYLYLVLNELQQSINFDWVRKAHPSVIRGLYNHISIPPLETQEEIVARVDEVHAKAENLSDTSNRRKNLFTHLQSASFESLLGAV
jgi:type I restriction enzyme S subunit